MVMKYLFEKTQEPKKQFHYIEFMKEIRASIQKEFEGLSNPIEKTAIKMAQVLPNVIHWPISSRGCF